ncbi:hypothetical protein MSG28_005962 [Choristoneura fumiferana]|uniref:Uncharacterized protein n=1 Tax=Choristoneura fumiferana TaxID=7141 RepID=A0ACC0L1S5_CHOFU|nr:hypothetical protein MSG28_005962 [Choristoneura fumiferana]
MLVPIMVRTTSKVTAEVLHYGDKACMLNTTHSHLTYAMLPVVCEKVNSSEICESLTLNGTKYCEWGYNGLGIDYQVLAGPAFMAVFTVVGVILGVAADKYNRARILAYCTLIFVIAIILMGAVEEYWHLVVLRMIMAAGESGCNPLATGILTDLFPEHQRALVLSIFNWGIYGGYGIAFPVGRYIPDLNAWGLFVFSSKSFQQGISLDILPHRLTAFGHPQSWRVCYYGAGIVGIVIAILTFLTLREPERTTIGEEGTGNNKAGDSTLESGKKMPQVTIWHVIAQPRIVLLCIAASIRHCVLGSASYQPPSASRSMCLTCVHEVLLLVVQNLRAQQY